MMRPVEEYVGLPTPAYQLKSKDQMAHVLWYLDSKVKPSHS